MNGIKISAILCAVAGISAHASAATSDTINGTVTDATTLLPLGGVTVSSDGLYTTSDVDGTFHLLYAATGLIQSRIQDLIPVVNWNPFTGSFDRTGIVGEVSIQVRNPSGRVVTDFHSESSTAPVGFLMSHLPKGMYLAEVTAQGRTEVFKILNLKPSGTSGSISAVFARSLATGNAHTLIFAKTGYSSDTVAVPGGTQSSIAVKLVRSASTVVSLFDGKSLNGWLMNPAGPFTVNTADSAITMVANGPRAYCYTKNKYSFYRIIYLIRQVKRVGHDPGMLFFGSDSTKDALWGVQFALPDNWGWDYRSGGSKFVGTAVGNAPSPDLTQWTKVELLVNSATGTARAAVAQPITVKAHEIIMFNDPKIPKVPSFFAIQCHTAGQIDEYQDITIEVNPVVNDLITTK